MRCSLVLALILACLALSRAGLTISKSSPQTTAPKEFEFGDIISVPMSYMCGKSGIIKKNHYAIYVGNEEIPGKGEDEVIFHRGLECIFGRISQRDDVKKATEYDFKTKETTKAKMIQRITEMMNNCGEYNTYTNNCEHFVTYIRFGEKLTLQKGTAAGLFMKFCKTDEVKNCDRYKKMIRDAEEWEKCSKNKDNNNNNI